jgi:Tol biopolymer transport system component
MDANGGETRWLTQAQRVLGFPMAWSPDGSRLVYAAGRYGREQLFMIDVNGGEPQRLTWNSLISRLPAWRPS